MKEKIILTDADGTIVWWLKGFTEFMAKKGHPIRPGYEHEYKMSAKFGLPPEEMENAIREFNESEAISRLRPFADAEEYIDKLKKEGFRFICITSQSDAPNARDYRVRNLKVLFGNVFNEVHCLKMGIDKKEFLTRWKDTGYFWIEDHIKQARAGADNGLKTILITHPYNADEEDDRIIRVSHETPWKEIYDIVLKDYNISPVNNP
jgi:FMN phosphatase YigB (HAD superfamily)